MDIASYSQQNEFYIEDDTTGKPIKMGEMTPEFFNKMFGIEDRKRLKNSMEIDVDGKIYNWETLLEAYKNEMVGQLQTLISAGSRATLLTGAMEDFTIALEQGLQKKFWGDFKNRASTYGTYLEGSLFSQFGGNESKADVQLESGKFAQLIDGATTGLEAKASAFKKTTGIVLVGQITIRYDTKKGEKELFMKGGRQVSSSEIRDFFSLNDLNRERLKLFKTLKKIKNFVMMRIEEGEIVDGGRYLVGMKRIELFLVVKMDVLYDAFVKHYNVAIAKEGSISPNHTHSTFGLTTEKASGGTGYISSSQKEEDPEFTSHGTVSATWKVQMPLHSSKEYVGFNELIKVKEIYEIIETIFDEKDKVNKGLTKKDWSGLIDIVKNNKLQEFPKGGDTPVHISDLFGD